MWFFLVIVVLNRSHQQKTIVEMYEIKGDTPSFFSLKPNWGGGGGKKNQQKIGNRVYVGVALFPNLRFPSSPHTCLDFVAQMLWY